MTPVLILHNGKLKLTTDMIKNNKLDIQYLLKEQVIEYISAAENQNCLVLQNITDYYNPNNSQFLNWYTHMEIEQACFSISSLVAPYFERTQP